MAAVFASTAIAQSPDTLLGNGTRGRGGDAGQFEGRRGRGRPDGLLPKGITLTEGQRARGAGTSFAAVGNVARELTMNGVS